MFKAGDFIQVFLRCKEHPEGSWSKPVKLTEESAARVNASTDGLRRRKVVHGLACSKCNGKLIGKANIMNETWLECEDCGRPYNK